VCPLTEAETALTAVTDAGDAKIFILKQPDEVIVDPDAQA